MRKLLLLIPVLLLLAIAGIGVYLSPDDLATCDTGPNQRVVCQKADAIVALSGGNTSVRTAEAIKLYKAGWADYLIVSGAAKDETGPSNAAVMKQQAVSEGVPADRVITEEFGRTTHQNAQHTKELLASYEINRLIVVTSPYHQRRAGLEFRMIVGDEVAILNHPAPNDPDWGPFWWLTPRGWWLAGGELVKITATHAGESQ